jgi:hypothetical protein
MSAANVSTERVSKKMNKKMATVYEVLEATEYIAPKGWTVNHEFPNSVGVHHPTLTDDQFIMLGDVNGYFSFNDVPATTVCGSMEGLTAAAEIAATFWVEVGKHYPELTQERDGITAEQLLEVIQILKLQDKGE